MLKEITTTFAGDHHAFAVLTDTYEQAYVPKSVVRAIKLEVGRTYRAGVVENRHDPKGQTPWFVTFIEGADFSLNKNSVFSPLVDLFDAEPEAIEPVKMPTEPVKTLTELVHEAIPLMNGEPFLASDLMEHTGADVNEIGTILYNLHRYGKIAAAKVYKSGEQVRSTQNVWCEDVKRLLK